MVDQLRCWALAMALGATCCSTDRAKPSATVTVQARTKPTVIASSTTGASSVVPAKPAVAVTDRDNDASTGILKSLDTASPLSAQSPNGYLERGRSLLKAGRAQLAREVLIEGERRYLRDPRFGPLIERAIDADPHYAPKPRTIGLDDGISAIKYLGGGSTITLRFIADDKVVGAFKPRQKRRQSDFRSEIAAWRLCPLIRCSFAIPYNEHVRLRADTFNRLYDRIQSQKQRNYQKNFTDLAPLKDRHGVRWIHGTLKTWVHDFVPFPIERADIWQPWLSLKPGEAVSLDELAIPAAASFKGLGPRFDALATHLNNTSRLQLARQLSQLLVFDFLITNWDRFSLQPEFYGTNCQFKRGRIVSIDNGAAFGISSSPRVENNLRRVQRFSRQQLRAIRRLDRSATFARLFPRASNYDKRRFALFSRQRKALLKYVDGLVNRFGKKAVLCFE